MAEVKLGEVAREYKATVKDAVDLPVVGLEHLIPGQVELTQWSEDTDNTFTKGFKKGQMLFGRRRAYLKKAALAPFNGICSGDITAIEAIPERIMPELLPFVIQNDSLFDYAVEKSAGSLSPRVKWEHLKNYEFELPEMEHQRELVDLLWAMTRTKKAYQDLVKKTDELAKSQFIEMFGDPRENPYSYPCEPLSEISDIMSGITKGRKPKTTELTKVPYICTANVQNGFIDWSETKYIEAPADEISKYALLEDDILMIEGGDADKVGRGCMAGELPKSCIYQNHVFRVRADKALIEPAFLAAFILLPSTKAYFLWCAKQTTGIATINKKQLSELQVMYPSLEDQRRYLQFVQQCDKSKFVDLQTTISELYTCMIKSLSIYGGQSYAE